VTDQKVRYLVNASPHGDHVNGNAAFEGVTIVAHERARESMIHAAENAGNPPPPLPSVLFAERMELHVAGTTIELHYFGPAHTPGDTIVYLPEQKIAFLSEVYFNGVFTSLGDGFVKSHLEVLDEARALGADWFIPGHGYIEGQSREQLRAGLDRYAENVRVVYDAVLQHVEAGDSLLDTLAAIDGELGEFAEAPFYSFLKKRTVEGTYKALSAANQDR
jgi:cyclase